MTTVVGVDLSLAATGIADHHGTFHTIETRSVDRIEERLSAIADAVARTRPVRPTDTGALFVIEDFVTRSPAASLLGMVHGVVRVHLYDLNLPFVLVPPAVLKKFATGKGNATKADMRMALYKRYGLDLSDDNLVDAAWLRIVGLHLTGTLANLPAAQLAALSKVSLPAELVTS